MPPPAMPPPAPSSELEKLWQTALRRGKINEASIERMRKHIADGASASPPDSHRRRTAFA